MWPGVGADASVWPLSSSRPAVRSFSMESPFPFSFSFRAYRVLAARTELTGFTPVSFPANSFGFVGFVFKLNTEMGFVRVLYSAKVLT